MRMLHNNVLVRPMTKEQLGKIVLPESIGDLEGWKRGKVVSIGPDVKQDIKTDDIVVFPPAPAHWGTDGGYPMVTEGLVIIPENIIWAVE